MDQTKALQRLTEAADLTVMIEEILKAFQNDKLSPGALTGARITLKSIRESILASHDVFAGEMVARSRARIETGATIMTSNTHEQSSILSQNSTGTIEPTITDPARLGMRRRDLRAAIEKL